VTPCCLTAAFPKRGYGLATPSHVRRGMTLVEMLVATAITLIMIGLVAQLFGLLGDSVSSSRATIETNDQLRSVAHRLRSDLAGITVDPIPPIRPESAAGYLEIIEGPNNDFAVNYSGTVPVVTVPNGDCDDALLFTTQSQGDPFVGRFAGSQTIESPEAEVAWFCMSAGNVMGVPLFNLYRRQLLVKGIVGAGAFDTNNSIAGSLPAAYANYDLSLRAEGGNLFPNTLADLSKRENRFLQRGLVFPYRMNATGTAGLVFDAGSGRQGEDLMLTNVVAFDVRVFDPYAILRRTPDGRAVTPGDPGYLNAGTTSPTVYGAYVDLGCTPSAATATGSPTLSGTMNPKAQLSGPHVYDTGSTHYEFNGIDDDDGGTGPIDEGSNNADDNGDGIVDDLSERETAPPYPIALRGIEIRIRCFEPSSRQVRQVTVRHTFVPH
jgi:prepilin-type N-terminal cleavage/methylation domain-containing protein